MATSFSTENWLHWIRKGDLHFSSRKRFFPVASDLFSRLLFTESNGEPLVNLLFFRRRELLESLLAAPKGSATPFSAITDASGSSS
jgi:hypothetical protein